MRVQTIFPFFLSPHWAL